MRFKREDFYVNVRKRLRNLSPIFLKDCLWPVAFTTVANVSNGNLNTIATANPVPNMARHERVTAGMRGRPPEELVKL